MTDRWEQDFDFYYGYRKDAAVFTFLDMAAHDRAPVPTHGTALEVRVPMKHPTEDGLRSREDFEEMMQLETQLVDSLETHLDAIYWGREVTEGRTDFFFYVPDAPGPELKDKLRSNVHAPGHSASVRIIEDPEWELYKESYPNPYQHQTMFNRRLQEKMESLGDKLTKRRKVDHVAIFPSRESAEVAAVRLKAARFSTARLQGPDESGQFILEFHRKDACNAFGPDKFVAEVFTAIQPSGGTYDGWGSQLRR